MRDFEIIAKITEMLAGASEADRASVEAWLRMRAGQHVPAKDPPPPGTFDAAKLLKALEELKKKAEEPKFVPVTTRPWPFEEPIRRPFEPVPYIGPQRPFDPVVGKPCPDWWRTFPVVCDNVDDLISVAHSQRSPFLPTVFSPPGRMAEYEWVQREFQLEDNADKTHRDAFGGCE